MASAGCRKKAGVPMLDSVAAILRQMMPDLPMPVTITRPRQSRRSWTARSNRSSRRSTSARIAAASVSRTFRASLRSPINADLAGNPGIDILRDRVDCHQTTEQRLEEIQLQRVLRVTPGAGRVLVHFEKDAVDPGSDARRSQRPDVLRLAGRDTIAAARKLQAVRHIEHD